MKESYQQKSRVMIIDDEVSVTDFLVMVAEDSGLQAIAFNESVNIAQEIEAFQPDIILLDLCLSDADGIEVLGILAECDCDAVIVLISGMDKTVLASACLIGKQRGLSIAGSLHKPFDILDVESIFVQSDTSDSVFTSDALQHVLGQGNFVIEYDPIVVLEERIDSSVVGLVVNTSWRDKSQRSIGAEALFETLASNDLLDEFGIRLVNTAMESFQRWLAAGLKLNLHFLATDTILLNLNWPEILKEAADRLGVPARHVTVCFQNSNVDQNLESVLDMVARLRINRFSAAIETMGDDVAEIDKLLNLPFNELRLSKRIVNQLNNNMEAEFDVSTLVSTSNRLRLKTCALGVESLETLSFLRDCQCAMAMGPLFGKSLRQGEVEGYISRLLSSSKKSSEIGSKLDLKAG